MDYEKAAITRNGSFCNVTGCIWMFAIVASAEIPNRRDSRSGDSWIAYLASPGRCNALQAVSAFGEKLKSPGRKKRLLRRKGYSALVLDAIGKEALHADDAHTS